MKQVLFGKTGIKVPAVVIGCMRIGNMDQQELGKFVHGAMDLGANFFDHADIYDGGRCEEHFGQLLASDKSLHREDMFIQSKCGIRSGMYDQSKEYILESVDNILSRLQTDYLDALLLHRPDALVEPDEVAEAFDILESSGKVKYFGVSNHRPSQMQLLNTSVKQTLHANQLQFSIPVSNMVAAGLEVDMDTEGSADRDGAVLDYCRMNNVTIQAWSPFQMPNWGGCYIGSSQYAKLNETMEELAPKYDLDVTGLGAAWIMRHPANMQVVLGTTKLDRIASAVKASEVQLSRQDWYKLYLDAGHILP